MKLYWSLLCHTRRVLLTISMHNVPRFRVRGIQVAVPAMRPKGLRLRHNKTPSAITHRALKVNK